MDMSALEKNKKRHGRLLNYLKRRNQWIVSEFSL